MALLPNPVGDDKGNEQVTLRNFSSSPINLAGWRLRDRAGNEFGLSGTIAAGGTRAITMSVSSMPLNNSGDDVSLIDNQGNVRHHVSYTSGQAQPGAIVSFP
ncbi:MAG: lamin tail domain-containing protein [Acidobacteria bacterium]|nr:lamin tail domain-containing protein [Acidobacteriota bacterium]